MLARARKSSQPRPLITARDFRLHDLNFEQYVDSAISLAEWEATVRQLGAYFRRRWFFTKQARQNSCKLSIIGS